MSAKKAVTLHGTDGDPSHGWQPWMREQLVANGYKVLHPLLPDNHTPNKQIYNTFLFGREWDFPDYVMVGHSSCATAILNLLSDLNKSGNTIIMVTHNEKIDHHASRIITLVDGKIISDKISEPKGKPQKNKKQELESKPKKVKKTKAKIVKKSNPSADKIKPKTTKIVVGSK